MKKRISLKDKIKNNFFYLMNPKIWDLSDYLLLLTNIIISLYIIIKNENVYILIFLYFLESFIIAFFTIIKILVKKSFKTTKEQNIILTKVICIIYFLFIYGFTLFITIAFLSFEAGLGSLIGKTNTHVTITQPIEYMLLVFFAYHLFSFIFNFNKDRNRIVQIHEVGSEAFGRIAPIIIIVIFWPIAPLIFSLNILSLITISILKIWCDLSAHKNEHNKIE